MRSDTASTGSTPVSAKLHLKDIHFEDAALRGMRKSDIRANGRIRKGAFKPRSNGEDREGLSVSIHDPECLELHREKFGHPEKAVASIIVREVHEIGLDVVPDADEEDPRHALIVGIPDLTLGDAQKAAAERFAELLANRATVYKFPPAEN
jgi:hypothetical protein